MIMNRRIRSRMYGGVRVAPCKAYEALCVEIHTLAKSNQQLSTESCVVNGNRYCEA